MASMQVSPSISSWLKPALLGLLMLVGANPASAEVRALVLSADYVAAQDSGLRLDNAIVDGRSIASAFRRAGVNDVSLVEEAPADRWQGAFQAFTRKLGSDDIALVYYAGHGFQIGGQNFLVTADGDTLIALDEVMKQLTAKAKATILVVDACRENPLKAEEQFQVRGVGSDASRAVTTVRMSDIEAKASGLAQISDLRGLSAIVFFSTEPGNVAQDGPAGAGSPFAKVAAKELARRQSLDSAFRRIAVAVNKQTRGQQSPWRQGDLPFDVYLAGMSDFPVP